MKKVFSPENGMKVFKMNDYEWVAAENKEEAIKFYLKEIEAEEDDLDVREVNMNKDGMYTEINLDDAKFIIDKLARGEYTNGHREIRFCHGDCGLAIYKTFAEVINDEKITEPCIIATTEW